MRAAPSWWCGIAWCYITPGPVTGRLVFGGHRQREGHPWLLERDLHLAVELLPVVVELHDALRFGRHPEFVKLVGQITYSKEIRCWLEFDCLFVSIGQLFLV